MVSSLQTAAQLTSVRRARREAARRAARPAERAGSDAADRDHVDRREARRGRRSASIPILNSRVTETRDRAARRDQRRGRRRHDEGLVAPVVAGADRLSLEEINARITELAARARDGSLTPDELERRHVHRLERRHPPGRHHDGDPQSAADRHPLDRPHPRSPGRRRGRGDRRPADAAGLPDVRPPRRRRRPGRGVPRDASRRSSPALPELPS